MSIPWSSNRRSAGDGYLRVQHPFSSRTMYPRHVGQIYSRSRLMDYTAEVPFVEERLVPLEQTIPSHNIRDGWYPGHVMARRDNPSHDVADVEMLASDVQSETAMLANSRGAFLRGVGVGFLAAGGISAVIAYTYLKARR